MPKIDEKIGSVESTEQPESVKELIEKFQQSLDTNKSMEQEIERLRGVIERQNNMRERDLQEKAIEREMVNADPDQRAKARKGVATVSHASTKARFAIVIEESTNSQEPQEVPVGVNGRVYQIKRGVIAEVPPEVIEVLKNAEIGQASAKIDSATGLDRGVRFRKARRFPYRVLGKVINEQGKRINKFELEEEYYE